MSHRIFATCLIFLASFAAASASDRLRNPDDDPALGDAVPLERFGASVAVDDTTVAVGSFLGSTDWGEWTGSVRLFAKQNGAWVLRQKLYAPDGQSGDFFGGAVALQGDTLVVGAYNYGRFGTAWGRGTAYVFERRGGTWYYAQALDDPGVADAHFGSVIALAGDKLAIAAPGLTVDEQHNVGGVTIFAHDASGWHAQQTLAAPTKQPSESFGSALQFAGDELLVGAAGENNGGAVYVYSLVDGRWVPHQRLVGAHTQPTDSLGTSLASDGVRVIAGAPGGRDAGGSVIEWRLENGAWVEHATLAPSGDPTLRRFGAAVAQRDGRWIVGAEHYHGDDSTAVDAYEYAAAGGELVPANHRSVPYAGFSYGLYAIAVQGDEVFLGLPYRYVFPWSDAGEVRVLGANGTDAAINAGVSAADEQFGWSVAANSRWLFVGAPGEHRHSANSGAVFAYDRSAPGAGPVDVLTEPDGETRDFFGDAIALSGDTVLVGVPQDGRGYGSVRVYDHDGAHWKPTARWDVPAHGYYYGSVLAADAYSAIVGSPFENSSPNLSFGGAAYIYQRTPFGWAPPVRLLSSTLADWDQFGVSAAIDGGTAVVGRVIADWPNWPRHFDGAAHIFARTASGWVETVQLTRPPSPDANGEFGSAVAIDGDWVFVGAPLLGEVHVFHRENGTWRWTQRIASESGRFGQRVRVVDHELWVAAPAREGIAGGASLLRYRRSGGNWYFVQSIIGGWEDGRGEFARDFAVDGGTAFVSAPYSDGHAPFVYWAGSVRIEASDVVFDGDFED